MNKWRVTEEKIINQKKNKGEYLAKHINGEREVSQTRYLFSDFISDFSIIEIAIGIAIGFATKTYIDSLTNLTIDPLIEAVLDISSINNIKDFRAVNIVAITIKYIIVIIFIYLIVSFIVIPYYKKVRKIRYTQYIDTDDDGDIDGDIGGIDVTHDVAMNEV